MQKKEKNPANAKLNSSWWKQVLKNRSKCWEAGAGTRARVYGGMDTTSWKSQLPIVL